MKRIFLLKGLDCPNCSAKIEKEVGELDGVQSSVGKPDEADAYNQCCSDSRRYDSQSD